MISRIIAISFEIIINSWIISLDFTPVGANSVASPIALDKDKRIRMLEAELEELRHFHQTESIIDAPQIAT